MYVRFGSRRFFLIEKKVREYSSKTNRIPPNIEIPSKWNICKAKKIITKNLLIYNLLYLCSARKEFSGWSKWRDGIIIVMVIMNFCKETNLHSKLYILIKKKNLWEKVFLKRFSWKTPKWYFCEAQKYSGPTHNNFLLFGKIWFEEIFFPEIKFFLEVL